jgi:hypothetical protein
MRQDAAKDLLRVNPNEVIAKLNAGDVSIEPFDGTVDDVIDMAVGEMGLRLRDDPSDVPSHVLIKFVTEANKAAERRKQEKDEEKALADSVPLLQRVKALPAAHARGLLDAEVQRLELELAATVEARDNL